MLTASLKEFLNRSIWLVDKTHDQTGLESNVNEEVLHTPQNWSLTIRCIPNVFFWGGGLIPLQEIQSILSLPTGRFKKLRIIVALLLIMKESEWGLCGGIFIFKIKRIRSQFDNQGVLTYLSLFSCSNLRERNAGLNWLSRHVFRSMTTAKSIFTPVGPSVTLDSERMEFKFRNKYLLETLERKKPYSI